MSGPRAFGMDDQILRQEATFSGHYRGTMGDHDADDANVAAADRDVPAADASNRKSVYWHRDLPPFDAVVMGEHVLEATSGRMPGTLAHRDELWDRAYHELMENAQTRLQQEIARLGGHYAHVLDESIDTRHDAAAGEAWLHGRFTYALSRRPAGPNTPEVDQWTR